jgi:predicted hotdog family 3-hydroxylacyl-ACP dehydratase
VPDGDAWYARGRESAMPSWIGIELMAQAIAAHVSLRSVEQGGAARPGVLLGTREYQTSCAAFQEGEALAVRAVETFRSPDGLASYDCEIHASSGARIASAKLNVYEPPDFEQFILGTES